MDDLARAALHLVNLENPPDLVNVGTGEDISIRELAELVAQIVGFRGEIVHDTSKPDGTPVKRTDISLIQETGWQPTIHLRMGMEQTYRDFLHEVQQNSLREI